MQYSKKELSNWYNFGKLPKRHLPTYMNDDAVALDVFGVIQDTLKQDPEALESIKEFVDGI